MFVSSDSTIRSIFNNQRKVNILVGKNGQGKSTILRELCRYCISKDIPTIAIANSIFDKFDTRSKKIKSLCASSGIKVVEKSIINSLSQLINLDNSSHINNLSNVFRYIGYKSRIGVRLSIDERWLDENFDKVFSLAKNHDPERIVAGIKYYRNLTSHNHEGVVWIDFSYKAYQVTGIDSFTFLVTKVNELNRVGINLKFELYLENVSNGIIPLYYASSGELQQLSIMLFISSNIEYKSMIIIDEPENSLHPRWQRDYVAMLFDNFEYFNPKVVLATHSPLIAESVYLSRVSSSIYIVENNNLNLLENKSNDISIESILWKYFDYIPPQSNHLSRLLIQVANDYNENLINQFELERKMESLKNATQDTRQLRLIAQLLEVIKG